MTPSSGQSAPPLVAAGRGVVTGSVARGSAARGSAARGSAARGCCGSSGGKGAVSNAALSSIGSGRSSVSLMQ